jgi:hypothetical protein
MKRNASLDSAKEPASGADGVVTPNDWRDAGRQGQTGAPLELRVSPDEVAHRNGEVLFEMVREYVKNLRRGKNKERAVRELQRLVAAVPSLALRVPEVVEYLAELLEKDDRSAIAHIVGGARRGRPLERNSYVIAMIDLVVKQQGGSVAKACDALRRLPNSPFRHMSVERMRNIYSEQGEVRRAMRSYHVSEQELAQVPRDLLVEILGARTR